MKKLLLTTLLIGITTITMAETIDLDKSKGTDQEVISSLSPTPASFMVDENSTIKATFDIELQQKPISMREIKLKKIEQNSNRSFFSKFNSKKNKSIEGKISYSQDKKSIIFKPNQPLDIGYYEVEFKRLFSKFTPTTPMKYKHIKNIKYRFYVPEVINGHMLPPEPDETRNNSTLLGIDMNDNDVRDDVERKILQTYRDKPIKAELMLTYAKHDQKILNSSLDEAQELAEESTKIINCELYLMDFNIELKNSVKDSENLTYNTKERVKKFLEYNKALGGGSYGSGPADEIAEACDFDVEAMLKDRK